MIYILYEISFYEYRAVSYDSVFIIHSNIFHVIKFKYILVYI